MMIETLTDDTITFNDDDDDDDDVADDDHDDVLYEPAPCSIHYRCYIMPLVSAR